MEWTWQEVVEQWLDRIDSTTLEPFGHLRLTALVEAALDRARVDPEYDEAAASSLRLGGRAALLAFLELEVRV